LSTFASPSFPITGDDEISPPSISLSFPVHFLSSFLYVILLLRALILLDIKLLNGHNATTQKVAGSRPNENVQFFNLPNPSGPNRPLYLISL
jgi:hypothetical protein